MPLSEVRIFVGGAGTGKSMSITQMATENAVVGHGNAGQTMRCTLFTDRLNSNIRIVDTRGLDDMKAHNEGMTHDQLLREIFRALQSCNQSQLNIKIAWLCKPSQRTTGEQMATAAFIRSFGQSAWSCVSIFVKCGTGVEAIDFHGVWGAAAENGCSQSSLQGLQQRTRRFFVVDGGALEQKEVLRFEEELTGMGQTWCWENRGILYLRDLAAKQRVLFEAATAHQVTMRTDRCSKCGFVGDRRGAPDWCHSAGTLRHQSASTYEVRENEEYQVDKMEKSTDHWGQWEHHFKERGFFEKAVGRTIGTLHPGAWVGAIVSEDVRDGLWGSEDYDYSDWTCCRSRDKDSVCVNGTVNVTTETRYRSVLRGRKFHGCNCWSHEQACTNYCVTCGGLFGTSVGQNRCATSHQWN